MRKLIFLSLMAFSLLSYAEVGDTSPLSAKNIIEVKQKTSKTSTGKDKLEILVIYKDANGKRKLAYMSKSDYKKMEQAGEYNLDIEYELVEQKTKTKIRVK